MKPFSERMAAAVARLRAGDTLGVACRIGGVSINALCREANRLGIARRKPGKPRIYTLDEDAFRDAERRPEAAYWIGMILADGCICERPPYTASLSLSLSGDDGAHVQALADFLGTNTPTSRSFPKAQRIAGNAVYARQPVTRLTIVSRRIADSLAGYGVSPRKSFTARVLRLEMSPDFWRGVIDGDGTISLSGDPRRAPYLGLVGSRDTCEQFAAFIHSHCAAKAAVRPIHSIWRVETKGKHARTVVEAMYRPGCVALPRKAELARRLLAEYDDHGRSLLLPAKNRTDHLTREQLEAARQSHGSWQAVARSLGMKYHTLYMAMRRLLPKPSTVHPNATMVTFNGETRCVTDWARLNGMCPEKLRQRLKRGWPMAAALESPSSHLPLCQRVSPPTQLLLFPDA